jgi:hypothetical protein
MDSRTDYKKILLEKISKLISGELAVNEFYKQYYEYFLYEVPHDVIEQFSQNEILFFGEIQERLDWTAWEKPELLDAKSRADGWMSSDEYVAWVKQTTENFSKDPADSMGKQWGIK